MNTINKTTSVKKAGPSGSRSNQRNTNSAEHSHQMIAEAAYYHAEARGFAGGHEMDDWLEAEAEIDQTLKSN
ncbi:MAG: DUF2934 domain-containing protein [Gammaproteobacteria bacterium]